MKVNDHDHVTGKNGGSAHEEYNLNLIPSKRNSILFHNLQNYDSHHILQEIGKYNFKINVILKKKNE